MDRRRHAGATAHMKNAESAESASRTRGAGVSARISCRKWARRRHSEDVRRERRQRWRSRGQTLIFFALSVTVLIAILGLAVDTIRIYDLYARMQRAAEAGALAAVLYMPNNYTTPLAVPPADTAVCRALQETIKDGFGQPCGQDLSGYCPANPASIEVAVCPVAGKPHDLVVYITETSDVIFLSAVNVGPVTVTVKAQAEYLPPIMIGEDASAAGAGYFGGYGDCVPLGKNPITCPNVNNAPQAFLANINGPAELKEQGDPYVYCEEGIAHNPPTIDPSPPGPYTTYNGLVTNHSQYTTDYNTILNQHCGAHNTDQQPIGFSGPATGFVGSSHPGGYTYLVNVTQANATLWVYNAPYIPTNGSAPTPCYGPQTIDGFAWYQSGTGGSCTQGYYTSYGGVAYANSFTAARYYFTTTYTLYTVPNVTTLTAGTQVASLVANPYDGVTADLTEKGCAAGQVYDPQGGDCATAPTSQFGWTQLVTGLAVGQYRLEVEATSLTAPTNFALGWGEHNYGLKLCPAQTTSPAGVPSCDSNGAPGQIGALNAADITLYFPQSSAVTGFPLAVIPTEYAGRTIQYSLFDPGDPVNGNPSKPNSTAFYVEPPTNGQPTSCSVNAATLGYTFNPPPSWETSRIMPMTTFGLANPNTAFVTSLNGDNAFNGLWATGTITLPSNYVQGQWTLCGYEQAANAQDTLAIAIAPLGQSVVYLV